MAVAGGDEAVGGILAEQRDVADMGAIADAERSSRVATVGREAQRGGRAEPDVAEVELVLATKARHRAAEAGRLVELQRPAAAGKDRLAGIGLRQLQRRGAGN